MLTLRDARRAAKLTQVQLAAAAGMPQSTISQLESGTRNPKLNTVRKLESALGLDAGTLTFDGRAE